MKVLLFGIWDWRLTDVMNRNELNVSLDIQKNLSHKENHRKKKSRSSMNRSAQQEIQEALRKEMTDEELLANEHVQ